MMMKRRWILAVLVGSLIASGSAVAGVLGSEAVGVRPDASAGDVSLDDSRIDLVPIDVTNMPLTLGEAAARSARPVEKSEARPHNPLMQPVDARPLPTAGPIHDPLASTLRGLVNTSPSAPPSAGSPPASVGGASPAGRRDPEVEARVAAVKETLASGVEAALSPQRDDQGRVTFSLGGVDGFHVDASGNKVSVGFRDSGFAPTVSAPSTSRWETPVAGIDARARADSDQEERLMLFRAAFFIWDLITHPITLILLVLGFSIRVAIAFARIRQIR